MTDERLIAWGDQMQAYARDAIAEIDGMIAASYEAERYEHELLATPHRHRRARKALYIKYADAMRRFGMTPLPWSNFRYFP